MVITRRPTVNRDTKAEQAIWSQFLQRVPWFKPSMRWLEHGQYPGLDGIAIFGKMEWLVNITPLFEWQDMVTFYTQTVRPLQYDTKRDQKNGLVIASQVPTDVGGYATELDMYAFQLTPGGVLTRNSRPVTEGSISFERPVI